MHARLFSIDEVRCGECLLNKWKNATQKHILENYRFFLLELSTSAIWVGVVWHPKFLIVSENDAEELDTVMFQRLAHIHWLTDQYIDGKLLQDDVFFSKWLATYYQCWGAFLDTPESFSPEILECYISRFPQWRVQVSIGDGKADLSFGTLSSPMFKIDADKKCNLFPLF